MAAPRSLTLLLLSVSALLVQPVAADAKPLTRKKAVRIHPRYQKGAKRKVQLPPGARQAAPNSGGATGVNPWGTLGAKTAGKKVTLTPARLVDGNVALAGENVTIIPVGGIAVQKPTIIVETSLHILYPMGQLPGTELKVKCEGQFDTDVIVTVGDARDNGVLENFTIAKKTNGKKRTALNFIVETDDLPSNSVLLISMQPDTVHNLFHKCTVEQLDP